MSLPDHRILTTTRPDRSTASMPPVPHNAWQLHRAFPGVVRRTAPLLTHTGRRGFTTMFVACVSLDRKIIDFSPDLIVLFIEFKNTNSDSPHRMPPQKIGARHTHAADSVQVAGRRTHGPSAAVSGHRRNLTTRTMNRHYPLPMSLPDHPILTTGRPEVHRIHVARP